MAKVDRLIQSGENTIITAEEDFATSIQDIEKQLLKEINKLFDEVDIKGGKIQTSDKAIAFLATIDKRIDEALKKAGYSSRVKEFLKNFDTVLKNNIAIHSALNGESITAASLNTITKLEVENTISKLLGAGISRDFKYPIREALYRNVILGSTIQDAQKTISDYIISNDGKDSKLLRYTRQVARDSINQYDGAIQTAIKNELNLNDFLYSGSVIVDSRCQCRYWVDKQKLDGNELVEEIQTALDGGQLGGCTCSGMIPGTSVDNFAINRGGYNCRHRALPTNFK